MADLGTLFVKIDGDTKDFDKSIDKTEKKTTKLSKNIKTFGANMTKFATLPILAAGAGLVKLTTSLGKNADRLLDLEQITGLSTTTLQEFQNVATVAGVSFEGLTGIVQKFSSRLPTIESGTSESAKAFKQLSVDLKDANGEIRNSEDLVPELITALQDIENVTERNAVAQQVFGRSLGDLAPVLGLTAEETQKARDEAKELGLVWEREAIVNANEFRIQTEQLTNQFKQQGVQLGSSLIPLFQKALPAISQLLDKVVDGVEFFSELSDESKNLIFGIAGLTAGIAPAIKAITGLKAAFTSLSSPIGLVLTAITAVVAGLKALEKAQLGKIEEQFGSILDSTGKTAKELVEINNTYTKLENSGRSIEEKTREISEQFGITQNQLIAILSTNEDIREEERQQFQNLNAQNSAWELLNQNGNAYLGAIEEVETVTDDTLSVTEDLTQAQIDAYVAQNNAVQSILDGRKSEIDIIDEQIAEITKLSLADSQFKDDQTEALQVLQQEKQSILDEDKAEQNQAKVDELQAQQQFDAETRAIFDQAQADRKAAREKEAAEEQALREALIANTLSAANSILTISNNLNAGKIANLESAAQAEINALDESILGEEEYASQVKEIEKDLAEEIYRYELESFRAEKALSAIQAAVNTAVALTNPAVLVNPFLFGAVSAAGALQVGAILSQPEPPKPAFAQGGEVSRATTAIVGEDRGDVLIGMGAKGAPLKNELENSIADKVAKRMGARPLNISVEIDRQPIYDIINAGIESQDIRITNENIQGGI